MADQTGTRGMEVDDADLLPAFLFLPCAFEPVEAFRIDSSFNHGRILQGRRIFRQTEIRAVTAAPELVRFL